DVRAGLAEDLRQQIARVGLVVDDEDPPPGEIDEARGGAVESPIDCRWLRGWAHVVDGERQLDHQGGAAALSVALRAHAALVELDDVPHDREPEPETTGASRPLVLPEAVEDVREHFLTDAATRVADRQARARARALEPKVDAAAAGGELDRVRE